MSLEFPEVLGGDCKNCEAQCCWAVARRETDGFPTTTEAMVACENLDTTCLDQACKIHDVLDEKGWGNCRSFGCYGAGQMVTAYFKNIGVSWVDAAPLEKNEIATLYQLVKYLCESLAKCEDSDLAALLKPKMEESLMRLRRQQMFNPGMSKEALFAWFVDDCPEVMLLFKEVKPLVA